MENTATSSAHTPGPWVFTESGRIRQQAIIDKWDDDICRMPFSSLREAEEMGPHQLANARLIAAAPELLDACKMLLQTIVRDCDSEAFGSEISHAEGVIAKAEGRET